MSKNSEQKNNSSYGADSIKVLKGLDEKNRIKTDKKKNKY